MLLPVFWVCYHLDLLRAAEAFDEPQFVVGAAPAALPALFRNPWMFLLASVATLRWFAEIWNFCDFTNTSINVLLHPAHDWFQWLIPYWWVRAGMLLWERRRNRLARLAAG